MKPRFLVWGGEGHALVKLFQSGGLCFFICRSPFIQSSLDSKKLGHHKWHHTLPYIEQRDLVGDLPFFFLGEQESGMLV